MALSLLQVVQKMCQREGLPTPASVLTSQDDNLMQIAGLLEQVVNELTSKYNFTEFEYQCIFTSKASSDQGAIQTLAPGLKFIRPNTFWDQTRRLPMQGPATPDQWAELQALPNSNPFYAYRTYQGHLWTWPAMQAGHTMYFEYVSNYAISSVNPNTQVVTPTQYFIYDADMINIDSEVLIEGLRVYWKQQKGFDMGTRLKDWLALVANATGNNGPKPKLSMDDQELVATPGIFVTPMAR